MLCEHCQRLSSCLDDIKPEHVGVERLRVYGKFNTSIANIEAGDAAGCYICMSLNRGGHDTSSASTKVVCRILEHPDTSYLNLNVSFAGRSVWTTLVPLPKIQPMPLAGMLPRLRDTYAAPPSTGGHQALQLARSWLDECLQNHQHCGAKQELDYVPPRLFDLRDDSVRLLETAESIRAVKYATLSHCWGLNPTNIKLSTKNLEELKEMIPLEILPKTFQDAVITCRQIGAEFLWIDSLCILQDGEGSKNDWLKHVIAMKLI
jgi:hypothetical protein